jgi:hypothetical protein
MAYSDFTIDQVQELFEISLIVNQSLFYDLPGVMPSDRLRLDLDENLPLTIAINSEKARSEFLIAPVLAEVRRCLNYQCSLFSGTEFSVEPEQGLRGYCDFILSAGTEQYFISVPVVTIVEAKNENISAGLGQCIAEMVAAQKFNLKKNHPIASIYGVVTTGTNWRFLRLREKTVVIDSVEYYINQIDKILAILLKPFADLGIGMQ